MKPKVKTLHDIITKTFDVSGKPVFIAKDKSFFMYIELIIILQFVKICKDEEFFIDIITESKIFIQKFV